MGGWFLAASFCREVVHIGLEMLADGTPAKDTRERVCSPDPMRWRLFIRKEMWYVSAQV